MELSYKQRVTKSIVYIIIVSLAALLQNTNGLMLEIGGARCFLLVPVCVMLGIGEDERLSALLGLFGGMLWDLSSPAHMGFNAIFICVSCFISASLVTYIIRNTFITSFIFSALSIIFYAVLYWLLFIIAKDIKGAELSLFTFYLPSAIYTIAIIPLIRICINPIKKKLNTPLSIFAWCKKSIDRKDECLEK